ncbi:MAG: ABC transporter ATP-binding protein [Sulfurovum sp.]|nr:ABC transporter ATP-binding protein [Sulfurovum sp.]
MTIPLIEAKGLSHSFDYPLYNNVNIALNGGQSMAVVGRSGSGKSTLLHTLSTFLKPDSGSVRLFDRDIYLLREDELEKLRRDELGIIFQAHYLFKGMTGRENIEIASLLSSEKIDESLLSELKIKDVVDQKIGDLSGGQQQRVSIARVLHKKPKIIFADEPTGNLDTQTAMLVMDVLLNYIERHNAILFLVTHDDAVACRCDLHYSLEAQSLSKVD